jgi:hypothetical protein
MDQQNFNDEKGHRFISSDQANHFILTHPSWKHHSITSKRYKESSPSRHCIVAARQELIHTSTISSPNFSPPNPYN